MFIQDKEGVCYCTGKGEGDALNPEGGEVELS